APDKSGTDRRPVRWNNPPHIQPTRRRDMEATQRVAEMAGYFLGHALWSVSDGEVLVPILGYLKADDSRSMQRLAMGSIQAVATGERRINALQPDERGAVFIKDALVTLPTGKTDCLSLDIRFA